MRYAAGQSLVGALGRRMQFDQLKRRQFIALFGGAAAWPLAARAQQATIPVIGFLGSSSPNAYAHLVAAFRRGLSEIGYSEGQNVAIEYRWAEGHYDRLPALAADLVRHQVAAIVTSGGVGSPVAAKAMTSSIPILFAIGSDPVKHGFVTSLNRPGGNMTGVDFFSIKLGPKRLELLRDLLPKATAIAALVNPESPRVDVKEMQGAAQALGLQLHVLKARSENDFESAFAALAQQRAEALVLISDPLFTGHVDHLVLLAARYALPVVYPREFVTAGGLMSYGTSFADAYRQIGIYAGRILNGEKVADLPVMQPTKFELVINLKTATALGVTVPLIMQMTADEVIE
jgi:putative ABC transport system substrate-binding protein